MDKDTLLSEMEDSVGNKEPVVFFQKMVDVFDLLFERLDYLEEELKIAQRNSALAIQWEPKTAADMLAKQIDILRENKDLFVDELTALKKAYADDHVTQNYHSFCEFWNDTLGYHPFLDYDE